MTVGAILMSDLTGIFFMEPEQSGAGCTTLDHAQIGQVLTILSVRVPKTSGEWERWLEEIGFIPGERVELLARAMPGGDPLAIRVGQSTFALRCAEAACVEVMPMAVQGARA